VVGDVILGDNNSWHNNQPTVRINAKENKALLINSMHEEDGRIAVQTIVNRSKTKAFAVQNSSTQEETFVVYGDGTIQLGEGASDEAFLNITSTDKNAILVKHQDSHADPSYSVVMGIDVDRIQTKAFTVTKDGEQEVAIYGDGTAYFGKGASLTAGAQTTKLSVDGKLGARSVIILDFNQPFPDYVFDEAYCVDDLETTFNWIKKYKRLPGVISEEEVKENGYLDMGKLQLQMLEKIEELYLQVYKLQLELKELKGK
jgi:hypothetical protein